MNIGSLTAGVSEIELKPELGLAMEDGGPWATGYLTPLYVKALVLSSGNDEVALVTLDALGIDRADAHRAAELAHERCGILSSSVLIVCSHTHVAPSMLPALRTYHAAFIPGWDAQAEARERAWVNAVIEAIVEAICQAKAQRREASFGVISAELPWLVFNRRRHTAHYGVWTHWMGIPKNEAYRPEGPIDPELGLFVIRDVDYRPVVLVWNFTGHNTFNFGDKYSADLAYTVQAAVDERVGEHIPCLYLPACSGNTNYLDYNRPDGLEKATDGIASAIMAIYRNACSLPEIRVGSRKADLLFAQRDFSRYWWKHDIETKLPKWREYGMREVERFRAEAAGVATYQSDLTVFRLGDVALVGLPGEVFVEFGLMIKERSPFNRTYVTCFANDYAGYVATREAFVGGSYEVWPTLNARIGRHGGYLMVDKAIELLEELHRM